ncbi:MAG: adenosylmethionine--8-amino-7-oxononanoate aminotransferase BioA, partial [Proteobacteria bacterium]|nr:adenosylmethionine--8-amino-7-oxononanoate aminotransferase BioA [Pseudomonadota bacterium]
LELASADAGYLASVGPRLHAFFRARNLLLRPLGNTLYVMPPYCITRAELRGLYETILEAVDTLEC